MKRKNILICVTGLTPQIVTETLFCLFVKGKITIDEIYVLTTVRGREVILGTDKAAVTPKTSLKKEIKDLCTKYKIKQPSFVNNDKHIIVAKEESIELPDIRSDKQNRLFPNKVAEFLKQKTGEKNTILHCVLTGGRKSMSAHLSLALSLFGRNNDKLYHILTSEQYEFKGFYPVTKKESDALELSEIPYVRLRTLVPPEIRKNRTYTQLVDFTQRQLKILSDERILLIDVNLRELKFEGEITKLEPLEFALYLKIIERNIQKELKISIHKIISAEFAKELKDFIEENYSYYYFSEEVRKPWWKYGFQAENFRSKRSKLNKKLYKLFNDADLLEEFRISSIKSYGETSYYIKAGPKKFKIKY